MQFFENIFLKFKQNFYFSTWHDN